MKDAGEKFDPKAYLPRWPATTPTRKGNMLSMPFNSSTTGLLHQQGRLQEGGPDPNRHRRPGRSSPSRPASSRRGQECVYTTGWPSWVHVENFSAWHNLPIGTKENGMAASTPSSRSTRRCTWPHRECWPSGQEGLVHLRRPQRNEAEAKFFSGECAMLTSSSAAQATSARTPSSSSRQLPALPRRHPGRAAELDHRRRHAVGDGGKKPAEYKGVAKFFSYLSQPEVQAKWHQEHRLRADHQLAAYELTKKSGYYEKNPGTDIAIRQLNNKPPTANSKGLRFGNFVQGRDGDRGGDGAVLAGQEGRQGRDGRRGQARQRHPAQVRGGQQVK
jgi:sn-glycerol 3-phosphate transport system substrate-binding protein